MVRGVHGAWRGGFGSQVQVVFVVVDFNELLLGLIALTCKEI